MNQNIPSSLPVLVSVIVPVFGVEKYIERCIKTLFEQSMIDNVEFIFVNDATKDKSIDILLHVLKQYKNRESQVKICNHIENLGLAAARNTGMAVASGEYIIHVDSDDFFEKDMLDKMYSRAKESDADMIVTDYYLSFEKKEKYIKCELPSGKKTLIDNLIIGKVSNSVGRMNWNKMIKSSLYKDYNIHYLNGVNYNEDLVVMVPLCLVAKKIVKLDKAFTHYIQTNSGSYTKKGSLKSALNRIEATAYIENYLRSYQNEDFTEAIKIKRFQDKLGLLIASDGVQQQEFNNMFPELSQDPNLFKEISFHWRFAYKQALKGNLRLFNFIRYINLILKRFK